MHSRTTFTFRGIYDQLEYSLITYEHEYRNLMMLLKDKVCPDNFGQCGGMGRCGTCMVEITGIKEGASEVYRNEANTLQKMGIANPAIRLSCQVQINTILKNTFVQILEL
jgi:ferredoxin, 2Fe-2S